MAWLLPFVLLGIGCVSAIQAETQIHSTKPAAEELLSVLSQQQNLISELNSTLRDISVQLTELKVEVTRLHEQSEEQSTTLKELKKQKSELEKLKEQHTQLKQHQRNMAADVFDDRTRGNNVANQVDALIKHKQASRVAFYAYLQPSGVEGAIGPFRVVQPLVFRNALVNIGGAYNSMTGVFTATLSGAYHFEFYIYGQGHSSVFAAASLMKNRQQICTAYEHQGSYSFQTGSGATLVLNVRDRVYVNQWVNSRIIDNRNHRNTFSGHLLFTM